MNTLEYGASDLFLDFEFSFINSLTINGTQLEIGEYARNQRIHLPPSVLNAGMN